MHELALNQIHNFVWVGTVITKYALTDFEKEQANKVLAEKNCYAVYYTEKELNQFLSFFEDYIRPIMHNF